MSIGTFIYTKLFGVSVGQDELGNTYYKSKKHIRWFSKENRWVIFSHKNESKFMISPVWFKWLYYLSDEIPMRIKYDNILDNVRTLPVVYDSKYQSWRPD